MIDGSGLVPSSGQNPLILGLEKNRHCRAPKTPPGLCSHVSAVMGDVVTARLNFCDVSCNAALWAGKKCQQPPCMWSGRQHQTPLWSVCSHYHLSIIYHFYQTWAGESEILVSTEQNKLLLLISVSSRFCSHLQSVFLCKKVFNIWRNIYSQVQLMYSTWRSRTFGL